MTTGQLGVGGFEPGSNPAERRAQFDLRRQISEINTNLAALGTRATALETGAAWVSFTPSWTNLTVGNASINRGAYSYNQSETVMDLVAVIALGTTSSVSSDPQITIPDSRAITSTLHTSGPPVGHARYENAGIQNSIGHPFAAAGATTLRLAVTDTSGSYGYLTVVSATVPFTFGDGDSISIVARLPLEPA